MIGLFAAFAILFGIFMSIEWKMGDDASVPFRVVKQRSMAFGAVYSFFFAMPNFSVCTDLGASHGLVLIYLVRHLHTHVLPDGEGIQCAEKWC